ncbi:MAG: hypothetical protein Q9182_000319, partial [Xanthomendoza sp. 2 TL-2023]
IKTALGRCLTPMINNLSSTNIQLASVLSYAQKQYDLNEESLTNSGDPMNVLGGVDLGVLPFQDGVVDNVNTRAGLYIYLNAAGDITTLVIDLILASFDILANAMYRAEPPRTITILRSFLVNKLPTFLGNYAPIMFPPQSMETCISQALLRVDPAAFPSFSQMFDFSSKNSMVSEARQEFLFACALHQLIPEGSIEGLLGDVPMQSLPASGRYMKNELVAQCTSNPMRIEDLIGELDNMEGNAGEISGALIELLDNWQEHEDQAGLTWFAHTLWSTSSSSMQVNTLLPALHTLIKPPSMSADSAAIHSAVLSIIAEPLDQALNHTQRQHKHRVDINPLLETLKPHMSSHRHNAAAFTELESWASTPHQGLGTALPSMIRGLILWCLANGNLSPPNYTHRLLLHTQTLLGSPATLQILLDELTAHHGPDLETAFDIIIAMIIAPQPSHHHHRLTLLDALRMHHAGTALARRIEPFAPTATTANIDIATAGQGMMLRDSHGMPATDIDDVLAHTEGQIASGDFLGGVVGMEL